MTINEQFAEFRTKATLSTLWIFVFFNMIFRDLHEFGREGFLQEMMTGMINGVELTEELFLIAGIVLELSIAMVILSRVLPYRINRWVNIIVVIITLLVMINTGTNDMDDVWFFAIEVIGLGAIMWIAWRWQAPDVQPNKIALQTQ